MKTTAPGAGPQLATTEFHPPQFDLWTDIGSIGHLLLGWWAGSVSPHQALGIFAVFAGYQISQAQSGEPWGRVGGELFEFGLGMLAAQMMK